MQEAREDFVKGCLTNKIDRKIADKIFNFITHFAGYGFNKSHSAAYAMISYRTAYLKANFPVEFMTALLSSEKDNQDKVVQYIDEAKRLGLKVLPPDVNESFPQFTVVGADAIRFGLSAVKNVGQTAIDAIIQGRIKRNRFKSFHDLIEHVDLRVVNKKVLESLIKCGAFDSMGAYRSRLFAALETALSSAGELQKDRVAGQLSFFDAGDGEGAFKKKHDLPDLPEWPENQLLLNEKEMLGYYVTGHPLTRYSRILKTYSSCSTSGLAKRRDGEEVTLGGLINKLKFTVTKKNSEKMAIVTLEDQEGSIDALVFPKTFKDYGQYLAPDAILFMKGKLDKKEQDPKLLVGEITPISEAPKKLTRSVKILLSENGHRDELLKGVQEVLQKHPGNIPVYLRFVGKDNRLAELLVDRGLFVSPSEEFLNSMETLVGANAVNLA
jgi:DNA polymerase-3 subunit alpha